MKAKLMVSACCLPRRGSRREPVTPIPALTPASPASGVIGGPYKLARWTTASVNVVDIGCDLARLARGSQHAQDKAQPDPERVDLRRSHRLWPQQFLNHE